jgi:hypothetical protein
MSGRKVIVAITQAEAQALLWAWRNLKEANGFHADWKALDRAGDKLQNQLNAVCRKKEGK